MQLLKFSPANAKTKQLTQVAGLSQYLANARKVYSLDLPSGWTCPGALNCHSRAVVDPQTDKATIKDGPHCQFRCFSASQEALLPLLRKARQYNLDLLKQAKTTPKMIKLILDSVPFNAGSVRLHVGGDIFSLAYMLAIYDVAVARPNILFYFYTKSLHLLKAILMCNPSIGVILSNLLVTASAGGKYDRLIGELELRQAIVVYSEQEAIDKGLEIDHTDEKAATPGGNFSLLIHGIQPQGSVASQALVALKGKGSYHR
jgi:hypothetical protein